MGDGRASEEQLRGAVERFSRRARAGRSGCRRAGEPEPAQRGACWACWLACARCPIEPETFRATIRAEGKAVDANLRGFEAGLRLALSPSPRVRERRRLGLQRGSRVDVRCLPPPLSPDPLPVQSGESGIPARGACRLARGRQRASPTTRTRPTRSATWRACERFVGRPGADGAFVRELARHLAVRMSVEDVIRVAQLKLREARLARVTREAQARPGDIVDVTEYMKPGPEEVLGLLPPGLGRWALARVRHDRSWPLKVTTTRLSGFLRLKLLAGAEVLAAAHAALRRGGGVDRSAGWRWSSARLPSIRRPPARWWPSAALVRGYADTYKRGLANWNRIMDEVVEPALAGASAARALRRRGAAGAAGREQGPRGRGARRHHRRDPSHGPARPSRRRIG